MSGMEPERQPELRASDVDRERVLSRLRDAHAEGRLDVTDFYERLDAVYNARTYGELDVLTKDLPAATGGQRWPATKEPNPAAKPAAPTDGLPPPLRAMWKLWMFVVLINLVIWASVSAGTAQLHYFWPIWVAGPWGGVLVAMSLVWGGSRGDGDTKPPA